MDLLILGVKSMLKIIKLIVSLRSLEIAGLKIDYNVSSRDF